MSRNWTPHLGGIATVTKLELTQRLRSRRFYVLLALWFASLVGFAAMSWLATSFFTGPNELQTSATFSFNLVILFSIFVLLFVLPAIGASAINGDRQLGTLAMLQASRVSAVDIVVGKILAGWLTGLVFVLLALPIFGTTGLISGMGVLYLVRLVAALAVLALVLVVIGVGLSAVTTRPLASITGTYVLVLSVTFILPIIFALAASQTGQSIRVDANQVRMDPASSSGSSTLVCERVSTESWAVRTDYLMPLIYPNPLVFLSGAASDFEPPRDGQPSHVDVLQLVRETVRLAANPTHPFYHSTCGVTSDNMFTSVYDQGDVELQADLISPPLPVGTWMWNLVLWGGSTVAAFIVAVLRTSVPVVRLTRGQRIA